ncbi:hypothetical protein Krac_3784 [Ktedonobacter racemifer DSM 44963]|uniref:Uncharacterized protein n=1 Tax=Ktedonobacter racemifer DSM 44963 TaxID=485913 RepID=D6U2Z7_KTERA|nr:hypothetical protein Krac_3784 [Ktedonobacter racemifer DSM 44963]
MFQQQRSGFFLAGTIVFVALFLLLSLYFLRLWIWHRVLAHTAASSSSHDRDHVCAPPTFAARISERGKSELSTTRSRQTSLSSTRQTLLTAA